MLLCFFLHGIGDIIRKMASMVCDVGWIRNPALLPSYFIGVPATLTWLTPDFQAVIRRKPFFEGWSNTSVWDDNIKERWPDFPELIFRDSLQCITEIYFPDPHLSVSFNDSTNNGFEIPPMVDPSMSAVAAPGGYELSTSHQRLHRSQAKSKPWGNVLDPNILAEPRGFGRQDLTEKTGRQEVRWSIQSKHPTFGTEFCDPYLLYLAMGFFNVTF